MQNEKVDKKSPIPRYYQVQQKIETLIMDGCFKPGDQLTPERKLACAFGVDRATVKKAISRLAASKVLHQEWGKGTFISKNLKMKSFAKVKNLGITISEDGAGLGHPGTAEVLRGIKECIKAKNYRLKFLHVTEDITKKHYMNKLIEESNIDGILIRLQEFITEDIKRIRKMNIPLVLLEPYEIPDSFSVHFDYLKAFHTAAEYLIKLGHKKIALINGPEDFCISKKALKGYQEALKKHGLNFQEEMVRYGDYSESAGYELMKELLENFTPPTAILVGDDIMATGVMKAVREKKLRVPEDINITGCNDMPIASYLTPSLTTIKVPFYEIGRLGAEMLIKILSGTELEKTSIVLEPDNLIIRNSTGVKL